MNLSRTPSKPIHADTWRWDGFCGMPARGLRVWWSLSCRFWWQNFMVVARQDGIFQICLCLNCLHHRPLHRSQMPVGGMLTNSGLIKLLVKQGRVIAEVRRSTVTNYRCSEGACRHQQPSRKSGAAELLIVQSPHSARWGQCRCSCENDRGSCCDSPPCGRKSSVWFRVTCCSDLNHRRPNYRCLGQGGGITTAGQTQEGCRWCPPRWCLQRPRRERCQGVRAGCSVYMPGGTYSGAPFTLITPVLKLTVNWLKGSPSVML